MQRFAWAWIFVVTSFLASAAHAGSAELYRKTAYAAARVELDRAMSSLRDGIEVGAVVKSAQKTFRAKGDQAFARGFLKKQKLSSHERLNPARLERDERGWTLRLTKTSRPVRIELREGDPLALLLDGTPVTYESGHASETFSKLVEIFRRSQEKKASWLPAVLWPEAVAAPDTLSSLSPVALFSTVVAMAKEAWAFRSYEIDPGLRDVADFYQRIGKACESERKKPGQKFEHSATSSELSILQTQDLTRAELEKDALGCRSFAARSGLADPSINRAGDAREACREAKAFFDCADRFREEAGRKASEGAPDEGADHSMDKE